MNALMSLFRRELSLAWGRGGGPLFACAFYVGLATMIPLASSPDPRVLKAVAPGVAYAALALASLLSLERLFERDYDDGALDLLSLGAAPLEAVAAAKCLAQWLATGAPLAVLAPVIAVALGAEPRLMVLTFFSALLAGLGFSFVGGTGAALSLGSKRGGVLVAVVVLPFFVPPVIFGAGALDAFVSGLDWRPGMVMLGAYCLAVVGLSPFAMAAGVRNAIG